MEASSWFLVLILGSVLRAESSGLGCGPAPAGWDAAKWDDPGHRTPKYEVGRILSCYPHTPEGLRQALPEIQKLYPDAAILGSKGDKLSIPGVGVIDVILASGEGGKAWQWLPVDSGGPPATRTHAVPAASGGCILRGRYRGEIGPVLAGFNGVKWYSRSHRTPKYDVGRTLSNYDPKPANLRLALPRIQRLCPGTSIQGSKGDKLKIPGVGLIDVIRAAGAGGQAWQWLPVK